MTTVAKRLIALIMALALMIPAVALSENEHFSISLDKTSYSAGENIIIFWEADTSEVDLSKGLYIYIYSTKFTNYFSGRTNMLHISYYEYLAPEDIVGSSGTYSLPIPDGVEGETRVEVCYESRTTSGPIYVNSPHFTVTTSDPQPYLSVSYDQILDNLTVGDEINISVNTLESYKNLTRFTDNTITIYTQNGSDVFLDRGKNLYTFQFKEATDYDIHTHVAYTPTDGIDGAFQIDIIDTFNVAAAPVIPPEEPVSLNLEDITIGVKQYVSTVKPVTGSGISWSSADEKIATVDENGRIYGRKKGKTTITATGADGSSDSVEVTVVARDRGVKKIRLNKKKATLQQGKSITLKAAIEPSNAKNKTIVWTSSDTSVATVNSKGKVKAVGIGKATITAISSSGKSAKCEVTVTGAKVKKITIEGKKNMKVGDMQTLVATIKPDFAENQALKWKSSNKKLATVDENGVVTAIKKGTVTITAAARDGSKVKASFIIKSKNNPLSHALLHTAAGFIVLSYR